MTKNPVVSPGLVWIFRWYMSALSVKNDGYMKLRDFIKGTNRQARINEEFDRLCEKMMCDPSFMLTAGVAVDNEFYARLGMSFEEVLSQSYTQKTDVHNQKHKPIY